MSENVKYIFNPFTAEFDAIKTKGNISAKSVTDLRNCLATVQVGDVVMESNIITNGVETVTDNTDVRPAIGLVINKPTSTTCEVLFVGTVEGFTGLNKGTKVFLNIDGTVTSSVATTGYLQCLGTARDPDTVDFNPQLNRVKRT